MKTPKIINAIELIDNELIESANKAEKKPFYIKPIFKRATAIAACIAIVAVTAFALTNKTNKITPNNDTSSGNNLSSNDASSYSSGETSSGNKKVIYVTGDTPDEEIAGSSSIKSLKLKYISKKLQEKMDFYKDYTEAEVIYRVAVEIFIASEDSNKAGKLADADKEVQYLFEQVAVASSEEIKAREEYNVFKGLNKGNDPETVQKRNELMAIRDEKEKRKKELWSQWSNLRSEIAYRYFKQVRAERLEFLKQFSENELETTLYGGDTQYIIDLTAEEINILAEKGGYTFRLSNEKPPVAENN